MAYNRFYALWKNRPSFDTPIRAEALQHIEDGLELAHAELDDRLAALARTPEVLIAGTITRDANGAATSAPVVWPDGTPGTYTALEVSTEHPGAVDSYSVTYGSPVVQTFTQPTVTRNAAGAVTACPAIVVS
ncbi:MAG: hypothetical protein A2Y38_26020 [Spirochaetes bacterium GWB1_59_5]|nr:MAG: hypothetical protein A2Y38_26020 [Spirochaetes bacterium GWB1_59_5]